MEVNTIISYFEGKKLYFQTFNCETLLTSLHFNEYVDREVRKTELFFKKIDFVCMAESLKVAVKRETGYKQLKRYLKSVCDMDDRTAQHNADKYNEGSRIYRNFSVIVNNCTKCANIDIRDFTVHELCLAVNLSWVIRRSASIYGKTTGNALEDPVIIDEGSVQQSVDNILNSAWYMEVKRNPALVANVMNRISERVVSNSLYSSKKR